MCDVGLYCQASSKTCKPIIAAGEDCSADIADSEVCGSSSMCIEWIPAGETESKTTCQAYNSIAAGTELKTAGASMFYCAGGQLYTDKQDPPVNWCMKPSKITDSVTEGVDMDATCKTETYTDTEKPETADTTGTVPSKCGFNSDKKAYCPQYIGNDVPAEAFTSWSKTNNELNAKCHSGGNPSLCTALTEEISKTIAETTTKVVASSTSTPQGYPNVANNPNCAKSTITRWYWNSDDSATGIAVTAAAVTLAIIF